MSDKPSNPPAFPFSSAMGDLWEGMDLRDYFAGQALIGVIQVEGIARVTNKKEEIVALAIDLADAMLKARSEETP